ncbi:MULTISPECIES: polysaccharide deacetylase family protein [Marinobacter]|uniref:Polysaccharide deacetylase family protein n=1 Tax=Marinobacter metalliresistant TaxID=2961995 RepID=A0ABZ2W3Z8_9GAMM|nr:polysaccharide deacetylase family protein [Marinobacter sp. Arc7-DN-1]AXS82251.1 polysaccharide deacetylase [Marinobacter sp. Arc7-DN-1]
MPIKALAKPLAVFSLLATAFPAWADLVVLQYHHVSDATPPATSTSVSLFEGQLEMISDLDIEVVNLLDGTRKTLAGGDESDNRIAITFDDAYESVYSEAAPLLASKGYPYTIFVNTQAVGRNGYMTWDQIQELAGREGITIANHSADHGHLAKKPGETDSKWQTRVSNSLDSAQETLADELGTNAPLFAYPYGEFDEALEKEIAARGWYGFGQQSGAIGSKSAPTRLPRFPMANAYGQLGSLDDKLRSKAFPVSAGDLPDGVISDNPPTLTFPLISPIDANQLTCFASGKGRIGFEVIDGNVRVQAPDSFNSRRFRYNCTHPAGDGSYYWLSQQWLDLSKPED